MSSSDKLTYLKPKHVTSYNPSSKLKSFQMQSSDKLTNPPFPLHDDNLKNHVNHASNHSDEYSHEDHFCFQIGNQFTSMSLSKRNKNKPTDSNELSENHNFLNRNRVSRKSNHSFQNQSQNFKTSGHSLLRNTSDYVVNSDIANFQRKDLQNPTKQNSNHDSFNDDQSKVQKVKFSEEGNKKSYSD